MTAQATLPARLIDREVAETAPGRPCVDCKAPAVTGPTARYCGECQAKRRGAGAQAAGRLRRKFPSNERIDRMLFEHYSKRLENGGHPRSLLSNREIGEKIGWPKHRVANRARELGLARVKEHPWSAEELALLEKIAHFTPAVIAKRFAKRGFNRSANGIKVKLTRLGLKSASDFYSATVCSKLLGVDQHLVSRWIRLGYLKARRKDTERSSAQGGDEYLINDVWVRAFVQQHPTAFDVRKVDQMWFLNLVFEGKLAGSLYSSEVKSAVD